MSARTFRVSPQPDEIKRARTDAGLTQTEAAALIHCKCRAWQQWEAGDRAMSAAHWELFRIKVRERSKS